MLNQSFVSRGAVHRPRGVRGFTLLELLIVVAIIAVLVAIAIPMYRSYVNKAQLTVAYSALDTIRKKFEVFRVDNGEYPSPPIDFTTGLDNSGRRVFDQIFIDQLVKDLSSPPPPVYDLVDDVYTVTATARDDNRTLLTLTLSGITR